MQFNIFNLSKIKKPIIFGPFVGELGWEIMRWSGFIRRYKKINQELDIVIATRKDRYDLYSDLFDKFELFDLELDNVKTQQNCYFNMHLPNIMKQELLSKIRKNYPGYKIILPDEFGCRKNIFDFSEMDFQYCPSGRNSEIFKILSYRNTKKLPSICITSRIRFYPSIDRGKINACRRNWGGPKCEEYWNKLFELIELDGKIFAYVLGVSPTYCKAPNTYSNMINIEDFIEDETSNIGLTIEAIKNCDMTVGSQTAAIVLSNLLKTKTMFWGNEISRLVENENIYQTKCIGLSDKNYDKYKPDDIYKLIKDELGVS
jgi:hypothetical protein